MALDDAEGIEIRSDVVLTWKKAGTLGNAGTFKEAKGAAGLYAFVLDGRPLYVGKSGGLKPGQSSLWVSVISGRGRLTTGNQGCCAGWFAPQAL